MTRNSRSRRTTEMALVTILEEAPQEAIPEATLLSEAALAEGWNRPQKNAAWSHLMSERSSPPSRSPDRDAQKQPSVSTLGVSCRSGEPSRTGS